MSEEYPEHEKLDAIQSISQEIGAFLEWLQFTKKLSICKLDRETDHFYLADPGLHGLTEGLLAEYFEIDLDKLEQEKRAMLDGIRDDSFKARVVKAVDGK